MKSLINSHKNKGLSACFFLLRKCLYLSYIVVSVTFPNFHSANAQNNSAFYVGEETQVTSLNQLFVSETPQSSLSSQIYIYKKENTITSREEDRHNYTTKNQTGIYVVEGTKFHTSENWQITYLQNSPDKARSVSKSINKRSRLVSSAKKSKTKENNSYEVEVCVNQTPSSFPFPQSGNQDKLVSAASSIVFQTQVKKKLQELFIESAFALVNIPTPKTNTHSIFSSTVITGYLLPYHFHNRPPPFEV